MIKTNELHEFTEAEFEKFTKEVNDRMLKYQERQRQDRQRQERQRPEKIDEIMSDLRGFIDFLTTKYF